MAKKIRLPDPGECDIVVWQKTLTSPTYCAGYTHKGALYLMQYDENYDVMKLFTFPATLLPEEFLGKAPKRLKIGCVPPGEKKVVLMQGGPLQ